MIARWRRPRCQLVRASDASNTYSVAFRVLLVLAKGSICSTAGGARHRWTARLHMRKRDCVVSLATVCVYSLCSHMLCCSAAELHHEELNSSRSPWSPGIVPPE